jgi:cell division protein FtsN
MIRLIPLMLAAALFVFSGCKKSEPPRSEPLVDTAMVLPEVPELEPLEEVYPEPEPEPVSKPVKKTDPSRGIVKDGAYTLQVGIYNTERQAQKRAESLKNQGFPAYVTKVQDPTPALSGTYYRVRIG